MYTSPVRASTVPGFEACSPIPNPVEVMDGFIPIFDVPLAILEGPILPYPIPAPTEDVPALRLEDAVLYPVFIDITELLDPRPQVMLPPDMAEVRDESDGVFILFILGWDGRGC